jgi:hypothetical protein
MCGEHLLLGVLNAIRLYTKHSLGLREVGAVVHSTHPILALRFLEVQPSGRRVSHNMAADRLLGVGTENGRRVHISHHLIGDEHRHTELVGQALQHSHEARQMHLTGRQFPSAAEVGPVEGGSAVNHQQRIPGLRHHVRRLHEQLRLVVAVVGARVGDVVEHLTLLEVEAPGDVHEALGTEGALSADVQTLALSAAHVEGQLTRDGQHVTQLRLPGAELAEHLSDGTGLYATYRCDGNGRLGIIEVVMRERARL